MNELIQKISSYHILNYLFSGVIFCIFTQKFTHYIILQNNVFIDCFLCYFMGLCISRVGSLIVEPLLQKTKFITFESYEDYIQASKKDEKINILLETSNMFRTLTTMLLILCFVKCYEIIAIKFCFDIINDIVVSILLLGLILLFLFAYKKQCNYITKRIKNQKEMDKK